MSANGSASVTNPGLLPVLWIDVPPSAHAASTSARATASIADG
ncbi:hypothetical protein [Rhodococcus sp. O3]